MRLTQNLDIRAARNARAAATFAASRGWPLNWFITIHWAFADGDPNPRRRLRLLQDRARHWFQRRRLPLALVWVFERGKFDELHSHILVHVPQGLGPAFTAMLERWIGGNISERLLVVKPCNAGVVGYVLKDVDSAHYAELGVRPMFAKGRSRRPIEGKRCGVSQAIGTAARARAEAGQVRELEQAA